MWFRYASPFGRVDSLPALLASAFAELRDRFRLLDRRHQRLGDLPFEAYRRKTDDVIRRARNADFGRFKPVEDHS